VTNTAVITLSADTPVRTRVDDDVALAAGGDPSAFERLYRTHVARIHSLTRRMLGIASGTSKRQLHRARMLMRKHLQGD